MKHPPHTKNVSLSTRAWCTHMYLYITLNIHCGCGGLQWEQVAGFLLRAIVCPPCFLHSKYIFTKRAQFAPLLCLAAACVVAALDSSFAGWQVNNAALHLCPLRVFCRLFLLLSARRINAFEPPLLSFFSSFAVYLLPLFFSTFSM